jgi:hypothetical protein
MVIVKKRRSEELTYHGFLAVYVKQSGNSHYCHFVNMFAVQMYSVL